MGALKAKKDFGFSFEEKQFVHLWLFFPLGTVSVN